VAPFRAEVRIRHRTAPIPATVRPAETVGRAVTRWVVETDTPVWAAAPGQAAVLYDGDVVLGGGRICRPAPTTEATRVEPALVSAGA
jgi:tRNA-specific 2-thiouridylase